MIWYSGQRTQKSLAVKVDAALNKSDCEQNLMERSNSVLIERIGMIKSQLITTASILSHLSKSITPVSSLAKVLQERIIIICRLRNWEMYNVGRMG